MKLELGGLDDVDVSAMLANARAHVMAEAATAALIEARRTGSTTATRRSCRGRARTAGGERGAERGDADIEEPPAAKADEPKPDAPGAPHHEGGAEGGGARGAGESPPPSDKKRGGVARRRGREARAPLEEFFVAQPRRPHTRRRRRGSTRRARRRPRAQQRA